MRDRSVVTVIVLLFGALVVGGAAVALDDTPVFLDWLKPGNPRDQVIRVYWERVSAGNASATEMVDLGTMLFHRGYPKDAVRLFKQALDIDPHLAEAWFRIGIVRHHAGELGKARRAYRKCLKKFPGHGWCNFYLGWCEEQRGEASEALHHYRRAFRFAPELADPRVNPLVLRSDLQPGLSAMLENQDRFEREAPLSYLESTKVERLRRSIARKKSAKPTPTFAPRKGKPTPTEPPDPTPIVVQPTAAATQAASKPAAKPDSGANKKPTPTPTPRVTGKYKEPPGSGPGPRRLRRVPVRPSFTPTPTPDGNVN